MNKTKNKAIKKAGDDLLSQRRTLVPSAKKRFTSVFGMGTGISTSLWSPASYKDIQVIEHHIAGRNQKDNMVKPHGILVMVG